jgi:uncharacterized protein (TIGR03000 family)
MMRKGFSLVAVLALAVVMVVMDASQARERRRGRRVRDYADDSVITNPQTEIRQANYFGPETADTTATAPVFIEVRVPGTAQLMFEGEKTTQTGPSRSFVSPPLRPGRTYVYEIKAKWMENDREAMQTRKVTVRAGEQVTIDFTLTRPTPEPERRRLLGRRRGS